MLVTVQSLIANGKMCSARSDNDILFVFDVPIEDMLYLGHVIELDPLAFNKPQIVRNLTTQKELNIVLMDNNVHDLRLQSGHGTNRTPSYERLCGA
jgi:hypothetical protein